MVIEPLVPWMTNVVHGTSPFSALRAAVYQWRRHVNTYVAATTAALEGDAS